MGNRLQGLQLSEHNMVGVDLLANKIEFEDLQVKLQTAYGVRSKEQNEVEKILKSISKLRCLLDSDVFREYPEHGRENLLSIYYPHITTKSDFKDD